MSNKILEYIDQQMQDHLAYWKQQLADAPQVLDLPKDHSRPSIQGYSESRQTFILSRQLTDALYTLSLQTNGTLYTTLIAAFQTLLYRYTGQDDFLLGTVTANGKNSEAQKFTDDFFNTLVLRANLLGDPTFCALLQQVQKVIVLAHQHDDIPLESIIDALRPEQNIGYHPLFQVMFSYLSSPQILPISWTVVYTDEHRNVPDLHLEIVDQAEGLSCNFVYNADVFDASTISRMNGHWQRLLEGIVADPMQHLTELPLLTEEERHLLLVEWNNTARNYPKDQCVHQLFEAQVELTPDAVAVSFYDDYLTYNQLNRKANQLAHHLSTLGVGPDVLVGICMERSLEMVIGLLGVLKAGGAYLPLDPTYPAERLAFMLEDAQAPVLLTQQRLKEVLPAHRAASVYLDSDWDTIAQEDDTNLIGNVQPRHLAYVIYTSGSTGRPKGVMIPHQGLVNYLSWCTQAYAAADGQGTLVHSPLGFDLTVTSLFSPLLVGQKAILLPEDKGTEALHEALDNNSDVTLVKITPAHLKLLSQTLPIGNAAKARTLVIGGEALLAEDVSFWRTYAPATRLINEYGPTETVVGCSIYEVPATASLSGPISIGRPIANTQLYILDEHRQPVPINVPGELYIGGAGIARGYLNRPELTAERFIPHPWSTEPNARLYKTGDLARYRADGNIEFLGRLDHQVKIRGFRIELGEIETVLELHSAVRKAIVVAHEASPGDTRLVAYIRPKEGQAVTEEDLQTYVGDHVPNYMIPSAIIELDAFPLTANGKIDRRALPAPDYTRRSKQITASRTPTEEIIAQTWSKVLSVPYISIDDDFFALGGHSLLAMRVIASLRTDFSVELPLRSFFDAPTVAQLAQLIDQQQSSTTLPSMLPMIELASREQYRLPTNSTSTAQLDERLTEEAIILPASLNQQSLWLVDQMEQESAAYNLSTLLRLHTHLEMEALQQSIQALVERHETLRTNFMLHDEQLMQVIAPTMKVAMTVVDLQEQLEEQRDTEMKCLISHEIQQRFDLARGPLLRATVFHLGAEEHVLLLVLHHVVSDGWSEGILCQDLSAFYDAFTIGRPTALPALPIQYADFALWQREHWQQERVGKQLDYWKEHLAGVPPVLELPGDRSRPTVSTHKGSIYTFALSASTTQRLKNFSKQESVTLYTALMTAFTALLHRYTGQDDLVLGTVTAGRNQQETHDLIGYFVNTLVLRSDLSGNPTVRELLERVRETVLAAQAHQEVSFEQLVKELQPERSLSFAPLIQVLLTLDPPLPTISSSWELTSLGLETGSTKFDLALALAERPDGLLGSVEYSTDLFEEATIARMMRHWQILLEAMIANPAQPLSQLPLLTQAEQEQLLVDWQAPQVPLTQMSLPRLIEEQVARTPDAVALVFENQELTYHDLNSRANQLAHHIQALGVGPEVIVGMCVERSIAMIVSLLAILKAGGVYVPMDPAYPRERLAFIMDDTHMPVLLTQQHLVHQFPQQKLQLVCLDTDEALIAQHSIDDPINEVEGEQSAYVIYTSGSTGQPKGVLVSHAVLTTHCQIITDAFDLQADDRVLQFSAITFDPSLEQVLAPLLVGARIVLRGPDVWSPAELRDKAKMYGLTVANLPTAYWHHVAQDWASVPQASLPTSLRLVIPGGDKLVAEALSLWRQTELHSVRLLNAYGPTETTIATTLYDIDCWSEATLAADTVPIGRPLPNRKLYILDHAGNLVPVGVVGELNIGGPLLARGYLNRPELTAERFVADPFSNDLNARMYRTGDLVRYRTDGIIEFVGRADQQVKIRGFRIELGEIEATLIQHPDVSEVVVLAREGASGDKALIAYVVADQRKKLEVSVLRSYLKERLPEYMLPAAFVPMDALPLLPTGKINRNALPTPELKKLVEEDSYVAPKLLVHQQLAQIWEELLDVRPIGIKDNFFYLGGHSLLAARLVDRMKHVFGKSIALSTLFSGPTIEQLAEALHQQGDTSTRATLLPVQVSGSKRPLFFLHGDWTGGAFYCFALGRVLGPDQPFYVLEPYKFNGLHTLPSFEEIARAHIEAIRVVQPQGPYLLGGFCNGGLLAYEIARQLEAAGEQIDFLGLINPTGPIQYEAVRAMNKRIGKFLPLSERQQINLLIRTRHALRHIYRLLFPSGERVKDFGQLLAIDPRLNAMFPPVDALYNDYVGGFAGIMSRYETGGYSGRMTFYWASEEPGIENVWLPITDLKNSEDIESYVVPGTHMSCVTDYIQELAQCFSSSLQKAQANAKHT